MQMIGPRIQRRLLEVVNLIFKVYNIDKIELSSALNVKYHTLNPSWGIRSDAVFLRAVIKIILGLNLIHGITRRMIELRIPDGDLLFAFIDEYGEDYAKKKVI